MHDPSLLAAVEWDALTWSRALAWAANQGAGVKEGIRVLEVGGRTGALAGWFASRGARVVSIDLAGDHPVDWHFPDIGKVNGGRGDVLSLPVGFECDLVISKSVLGAIGGRGGAVAQARACQCMAAAVTTSSGEVWVLENLVASPLHALLRRCFVPWSSRWRYMTTEELLSFFENGECRVRSFGFVSVFGRWEWQRHLLARCDAILLERLTPSNWHYVGAVVAWPGRRRSISDETTPDSGKSPPPPNEEGGTVILCQGFRDHGLLSGHLRR